MRIFRVYREVYTCAVVGNHQESLSHGFYPLVSPNSCTAQRKDCALVRPAALTRLLSVSGWNPPSFGPFKTLPQPLSHICFSRRKKIQ